MSSVGKKSKFRVKFRELGPTLQSKDLIYSMENSKNFYTFRSLSNCILFLFSVQFVFSFTETKRFDAKPTPRAKYLVNTRPPVLRYADPVVVADRRVLLSLASLPSVPTPVVEQNATTQPDIPLIPYGQDEMPITSAPEPSTLPESIPMLNNDAVLPAPDPFQESATSGSINSTDDLLNLFEQRNKVQSSPFGYNTIPFIPPFTSAPDNLRLETRASYRKVRK